MTSAGLPPLPDNIPPCPFCGLFLRRDDNRNTGAAHPVNPECVMSGWFIGARNLTGWAMRRSAAPPPPPNMAARVLTMTVEDGRPVFHDDASGRPVTARELNHYIEWYESQRGNHNG